MVQSTQETIGTIGDQNNQEDKNWRTDSATTTNKTTLGEAIGRRRWQGGGAARRGGSGWPYHVGCERVAAAAAAAGPAEGRDLGGVERVSSGAVGWRVVL